MLSHFKFIFQKAVFWIWLTLALRMAGFMFVLPLVLRQLPSSQVGLWYVFASILGVCGMVELGFSSIISRYTSYYAGGYNQLPSLSSFTPSTQDAELFRPGLAGLVHMSRRLYRFFSIVVFFCLFFGGGTWLLLKYRDAILQPENLLAFIIFTAGSTWAMAGNFWPGLLVGFNRVIEAQTIQIQSILLNYSIIAAGLFFHLGIFTLVLSQVGMVLFQRLRGRHLFKLYCPLEGVQPLPVQWYHLWPMTWRSGVMNYASNFPLNFSTLICAQLYNLETTARYALSLQLVTVAIGLGNGWLGVKYPIIATYYTQGKIGELRQLIVNRLFLQGITYFVVALGAWALAPLILFILKTRTNFIDPIPLGLLMVAGGIDMMVNTFSTIIQTSNRFPFIKVFIFNAALTAAFSFTLGKWFGLSGMISGLILAQFLFTGWYVIGWGWRDLHRTSSTHQ